MIPDLHVVGSTLQAYRDAYEPAKRAFFAVTEGPRADLLKRIVERRNVSLDDIAERALRQTHGNPRVAETLQGLRRYAEASDWNLVDVVLLAAAAGTPTDSTIERLAGAALAFHALRMIDDVLDVHLTYKESYPTMLGDLCERLQSAPCASQATLLGALLLLCDGLLRSSSVHDVLQHTIVGAMHESLAVDCEREYDDIVVGKMVHYGLVLYGPVLDGIPAAHYDPVAAFLKASFRVGQLSNDLADGAADHERRQPNFWNIHRRDAPARFLREFGDLAASGESLPDPYRRYALARVADLAGYGVQIVDRLSASNGREH